MIKIGQLRHRVELQQVSTTPDGQGGHTTSWNTIDTLWAYIEPSNGAERLFAQKIEANYDHKIYIRNYPGINEKMRFFFNNRYFHVKAVMREEERRWYTKILAKEGVPS